MAESLEKEGDDVDYDKEMDSLGYKKEQFDKFIHDYREMAQPHAGSSRESDIPMDFELKKNFINAERKLKKASYTLKGLSNSASLKELYSKIELLLKHFKTIKDISEDSREEFNVDNVPLPDYDPMDIALLLGEEFATTKKQEHSFSKIRRQHREQILASIGKAEILLSECNEAVRSHKEEVLQNMVT